MIFDHCWASINAGSKGPIACNNSSHVPLWGFYLHCGIEETSSGCIICIVCHQVLLHPSKHGNVSMGKHLLAEAHIAKLNELRDSAVTELTGATVDQTTLDMPKWQGSQGITIVSSQRMITFDIQVDPC